MADQTTLIRHRVFCRSNLPQWLHKEAASASSAGVDTKLPVGGGWSTFDAPAFVISIVASDGRRKRLLTALFPAVVPAQTYPAWLPYRSSSEGRGSLAVMR